MKSYSCRRFVTVWEDVLKNNSRLDDLFPNVRSWLHRMCGRKSWRNAASFDTESIVGDMKHKMEKMGKKKQEA